MICALRTSCRALRTPNEPPRWRRRGSVEVLPSPVRTDRPSAAPTQAGIDGREELGDVERLADLESDYGTLDVIDRLLGSGRHYDDARLPGVFLLQLGDDVRSHDTHHQIEDHDVVSRARKRRQRLTSTGSEIDFVPSFLQQGAHQRADGIVIIDAEDSAI